MVSKSWQLNIAFQKCSVISFGHCSANTCYSLGDVLLKKEFTIFVTWVFIYHLTLNPVYIAHLLLQRLSKGALFYLKVFSSTIYQVFISYVVEYNTIVQNPWLIHDTLNVLRELSVFSPE